MPMTSLWCFSIKRLGTRLAGAELFFSMKPFYSINRVLSVHRARHGRPFIHSPVRRLMGCLLGCGCAALGSLSHRLRDRKRTNRHDCRGSKSQNLSLAL